jgi:hypothetical protein
MIKFCAFIESVEIKVARYQIGGNLGGVEQKAPRNSRHLLFPGANCSVALTLPWRLLFRGAYSSVVLTIPCHLNFHRFDQIKVARDKILRTLIESVEIKVARYQSGGNLGGVEQ